MADVEGSRGLAVEGLSSRAILVLLVCSLFGLAMCVRVELTPAPDRLIKIPCLGV